MDIFLELTHCKLGMDNAGGQVGCNGLNCRHE